MPQIIVHYLNQSEAFTLSKNTLIGRAPQSGLVLNLQSVSRQHAGLYLVDGRWVIKDLGSTNGTWVNGRRISQAHILTGGDEIRIGEVGLTYPAPQRPDQPKGRAASPIVFGCPDCLQLLKAWPSRAGARGKCQSCDMWFIVPQFSGGRARPLNRLRRRRPGPPEQPLVRPAPSRPGHIVAANPEQYTLGTEDCRNDRVEDEAQVRQNQRTALTRCDLNRTCRSVDSSSHREPALRPDDPAPAPTPPQFEPPWRDRAGADNAHCAADDAIFYPHATFAVSLLDVHSDLSRADVPTDEPDPLDGRWFVCLDVLTGGKGRKHGPVTSTWDRPIEGHRCRDILQGGHAVTEPAEQAADIWPTTMLGQATVVAEALSPGQVGGPIGVPAAVAPLVRKSEVTEVLDTELDWWHGAAVVIADASADPDLAAMAIPISLYKTTGRRGGLRAAVGTGPGKPDRPTDTEEPARPTIAALAEPTPVDAVNNAPVDAADDDQPAADNSTAIAAADQAKALAVCAKCSQPISRSTFNIICSVCGANHHAPCWLDHNGCGSARCVAARRASQPATPQLDRKAEETVPPTPRAAPADPVSDAAPVVAKETSAAISLADDAPAPAAAPAAQVAGTHRGLEHATPATATWNTTPRQQTDIAPWDIFLLLAALAAFFVGLVTAGIPNFIVLPAAIGYKLVRRRRFSNPLFWLIVALSVIGIAVGMSFSKFFYGK